MAEYTKPLTNNQHAFIEFAEKRGLEIRTYSGRGMYGDTCPAFEVDTPWDEDPRILLCEAREELDARAISYSTDALGRGAILYAEN
jgi:hypothetical protein